MAGRWRSTAAAPNATSTSPRCCAPRAATASHRASWRGDCAQARLCRRARLACRNAGRARRLDEGALSHYESALAIDPRLVDARHGLGQFAAPARPPRRGRRAIPAGRGAQAGLCRGPSAISASCMAAQGRFADAAEHYQRAISIKPQLVDVYRNLGRALLADGRADEALAAVIRGLAIGETDEAKAVFVQCAQSAANVPARRDVPRAGRPRPDRRLGPRRRPVAAGGIHVPASESGRAAVERVFRRRRSERARNCSRAWPAIACCARSWKSAPVRNVAHGALPHLGAFDRCCRPRLKPKQPLRPMTRRSPSPARWRASASSMNTSLPKPTPTSRSSPTCSSGSRCAGGRRARVTDLARASPASLRCIRCRRRRPCCSGRGRRR